MKTSINVEPRRLVAAWCFLGAVGISFAVGTALAQRLEYVISFNNVVVQGPNRTNETPERAHREIVGLDQLLPPVSPPLGQSPRVTIRSPGSLLPFEPGQGLANASFRQEGFLVETFWATATDSLEGAFKSSHFHPPDLSSGFEAQHFAGVAELHGIYIRSLDGARFGLKSLRYRVTRNRQIPGKPLSIEGFSTFDVQVLIARSFDPRKRIRPQFMVFPVGLPLGNDANLPWATLRIFGFELLEQVYISSSASVDFDNIVLTRREPPLAVPEPQEPDKQ
jgi:hypothetical protein